MVNLPSATSGLQLGRGDLMLIKFLGTWVDQLRSRHARLRLLAGAGLFALAATTAVAQTPDVSAEPDGAITTAESAVASPVAAPSADAALADRGFYMEANEIIRNDNTKTWNAKGEVEVRYEGRTLRADDVLYDSKTGVVTARGKVQIVNADGSAEFADSIVLDKDFRAGVAMGFSTRQAQNIKMSSVAAIRRSPDSLELNRAVFTPCDICEADGVTPKRPTWSIRAKRVVQDRKRQIVYYRNAVISVAGVPVLFAPVFWHPDPMAVRRSGLLPPKADYTERRGVTYEQPYLWVISPSQDLVLSPQLNTAVNPFLNGQYRQRFWSGQMDIRFGVGYDQDFDSKNGKFGDTTARSYVLGEGAFKPNRKWTLGFSAERVSDDLIFRRYSVPDVYSNRGLYLTDDQRLISQVYAVRQDNRSFLSVAAFSVQGLRATDDDRNIPLVAPLIEGRYEPKQAILGGRLRVTGGAVALMRERDAGNVLTNRPINRRAPGVDSARVSLAGDWRRSFTTGGGLRIEPFADVRGDAYQVRDRMKVDGPNGTFTRALGTVGADVSWPFIRATDDLTVIVEPIAQVALSPTNNRYLDIPNEDSIVFDFDETNLFERNKAPGFDLYEGGQRLNVGARVSADWAWGLQARVMAGRSFRAKVDPSFPGRTSLRQTKSDWVTAASVNLPGSLNLYARARLEDETYKVRRAEVGGGYFTTRGYGSVRYLVDEVDLSGARREDLQVQGEALITRRWGVLAQYNLDLEQDVEVYRAFGLLYKDECTRLEIVYERNGTYDRSFTPSSQITVRLTLATLGAVDPQEDNSFR